MSANFVILRVHKSFPDVLEFFGLELMECHYFSVHTVIMIQILDAPALESLVICRSEVEFAKADAHKSIVDWNNWQFFHRFKDLFRHDIAHYEAATADIWRVVFFFFLTLNPLLTYVPLTWFLFQPKNILVSYKLHSSVRVSPPTFTHVKSKRENLNPDCAPKTYSLQQSIVHNTNHEYSWHNALGIQE